MVAVQAQSADSPLEDEAKRLRRHFKFTEEDLAFNRRGELSDKQKRRIAGYERGGKKLLISVGAMLLVPAAFLGAIMFFFDQGDNCLGLMALGLLLVGLFLIVSQFFNSPRSFKVLSVRGPARLEKGTMSRSERAYYDLYINDKQFDGDGSMPNVIQAGTEYIVYYLSTTEDIVSVERA